MQQAHPDCIFNPATQNSRQASEGLNKINRPHLWLICCSVSGRWRKRESCIVAVKCSSSAMCWVYRYFSWQGGGRGSLSVTCFRDTWFGKELLLKKWRQTNMQISVHCICTLWFLLLHGFGVITSFCIFIRQNQKHCLLGLMLMDHLLCAPQVAVRSTYFDS